MFLFDVLGLALTLATLALLGLGGYLLALRLLGDEALSDPLAFSIAALLSTSAQAVGIGLLLGALGLLRLDLALGLQLLLVIVFWAGVRRMPVAGGGVFAPARHLARRGWERVKENPAFSLLTVHAVGSEALRGLFRPPLSWDSLMYHLLLTATWLQERNLKPVFGPYPVNDYGYVPANGSVWVWWWMAPSHSELYVNLAFLAHWVLLGLAVGGVARQLGARRYWPLASFLILVTPTVVRFAATQYVDIFLSAVLLGAGFFALRWMRTPSFPAAVLAGFGLGLASGAKLLGVPYAMAFAGAAILAALCDRRDWPTWVTLKGRTAQMLVALLLASALGSYFYVRNVTLGAGPLALTCEGRTGPPPTGPVPALPRPDSVLDQWRTIGRTQVLDAFLGITRPQSIELGAGPQVLVLLLAFVLLPFAASAAVRRESWVITAQIAFQLVFWLIVPYSNHFHIFANIRYLIPALGLAFAGAVAMAEERPDVARWLPWIAFGLGCQSLLQLHAEMPHGVRIAIAVCDLAAVALALSPDLRGRLARHPGRLAAAAVVFALLSAPALARFRVADRPRALNTEWTAHSTSARLFAGGWQWLDEKGGTGVVDVVGSPGSYFVYPAMGPYLERQARYVNVNRANLDNAVEYPKCDPRVDPSVDAWLHNLVAAHARYILLGRYPEAPFGFPFEDEWAKARPDLFALRYADITNRVYEFLPVAGQREGEPAWR